jgi:hypothetical protein
VNQWDGTSPVTGAVGLTGKYEALRLSEKDAKTRARGFKELATLRGTLTESRWLALGRTLGLWKPPALPSGTPEEQAAALTTALPRQFWFCLGKRLGMLRR